MKTLNSLAFYALVTPAIALGSSAVLAQGSVSPDTDRENQTTQRSYDTEQSSEEMLQSQPATGSQSAMQGESYMSSAPANGMQASNLIGADVKTTGDEEVGAVHDLIIDQDGQVVAIVVGVGGFLGMGEKNVAISWDQVTKTGTADAPELRIDQTRDALRSAPEFETLE